MKSLERDFLLRERKGTLEDCNLWDFWDSLSIEHQNGILEYFENTPMLFDYTTLFKGDSRNDLYHGVIDSLGVLFVKNDLSLSDCFIVKFLEYSPAYYSLSSKWGMNWENSKVAMIEAWERIVDVADDSEINLKLEVLERINKLSIEDIYWSDSHFFIQNYSAVVYKCYLNGECNIERFENAFKFCYTNIDKIKSAITSIYGWEKPLRNAIVEQYLIYLEKEKCYDQCINILNDVNEKGWRNDFQKRLDRCIAKRIKLKG